MIPTCKVNCRVSNTDGTPMQGATITALLNSYEIYEGYVVPRRVEATTDAEGLCSMMLFPNQLGSVASSYTVTIRGKNARSEVVTAVVPAQTEADLHEIATLPPYPGKADGQVYVEAAIEAGQLAQSSSVTAQAAAEDATTQAGVAASEAATATTQAGIATTGADTATTQAGIATTGADTATTQAGIATTGADTATTQAGIATTQAGIATTKASEASASAATATAQAGTATTKASEASASASTAITKADEASASASTAITKAGEAGASASSASASAGTATTKAAEAAASAATALANAAFPAGTKMLFVQSTAPTGWTKLTDHDNKALRIVSGAAGAGGSVPFSTAFASKSVSGTVGNTTLSVSQMPSHNHSLSTTWGAQGCATGTNRYPAVYNIAGFQPVTAYAGGNGAHNHSFTGTAINMEVQYVDAIVCQKD
jgi:hypothetical protein